MSLLDNVLGLQPSQMECDRSEERREVILRMRKDSKKELRGGQTHKAWDSWGSGSAREGCQNRKSSEPCLLPLPAVRTGRYGPVLTKSAGIHAVGVEDAKV